MKYITIYLILIGFNSFGQQRDFTWYEALEQTVIPERLKNNDAIYIYDHLAYDYLADFTTSITIIQKVKILSKEGLDRYSKTYIPANIYPYIETFSARTIKIDGAVNELKPDQIVREGVSSNRDDNYYNHAKFVMSGLEVDDEFEIIVKVNYPGIYLGGDLILRGPLYSLRSKISITNYINMDIGVISSAKLNGFNIQTNDSGGKVFVWEELNLTPLVRENYSIPHYETSFLSFSARFNSIYQSDRREEYTWLNYASELNAKYEKKKLTSRLVKKLKEEHDWYSSSSSNQVLMYECLSLVNKITFKKLEKDEYYSLEHYVENDEINFEGRTELLVALFDRLSIPFYFGLTRDKYDGLVSEKLANTHQLDRLFLAVEFDNLIYYIFPTKGKLTLFLNEIPPIYEGNNALLVKRIYSEDDQEISFIDLPISDIQNNYRKSKILFKLDLKEEEISIDRSDVISGVFSYSNRLSREYLTTNEFISELEYDSLRIDDFVVEHQLLENIYPVKSKVRSQFLLKNSLASISDSVYSIKMVDILTIHYFKKSKGLRYSDFYPLYLFEDHSTVYIESDSNITLINDDKLSSFIDNEFINLNISFSQVRENVVKIDVSILIKKSKLHNSNYELYLEAIDKIESLKKTNLIFSI